MYFLMNSKPNRNDPVPESPCIDAILLLWTLNKSPNRHDNNNNNNNNNNSNNNNSYFLLL